MRGALLLLAAAIIGIFALRLFLSASPAQLAKLVRSAGGIVLFGIAGLALTRGQLGLAFMLASVGLITLMRSNWGAGQAPAGQTSQVRSAGLEMMLDHDSGEMDGRILAGRFEGKALSQLALNELLQVAEDFRDDADSLKLLETYLDRAHSSWRENVDSGSADRTGATASSGGMSTKEAYEILGLEPDASASEISLAHRRLMMQVHPDRGGSDALAAKINEAKDLLLGGKHN
jgi:hypothetical protein